MNLSSEAELVDKFRRSLREASDRIVLSEFDGIHKRPDLVHARIRHLPDAVDMSDLASVLRPASTARVLAFLRYRRPRTKSYLETNTWLSGSMLRSSIRRLERFGIVEVARDSVVLTCPLPLDMVEIVAYEGKLRNWRKAVWQARNAIFFATSSRIVMPESAARRAMQIENEFQAFGIGIIGFTNDDHHRVILRGRKRRPLCRVSYYQAVGKVLHAFVQRKFDQGR